MHIEPGIVEGAKLGLGYVTAAAAVGYGAKQAFKMAKKEGVDILAARSLAATGLVFSFFQLLPHYPVGVSEVHFIFGAMLFLVLGAGPAAIGLTFGLLAQGGFFAPSDLPQFGMNITSLLVPLLVVDTLARRIIPKNTAYKDLSYDKVLALSSAYQGGVVAWVAFWAFYGQGFGAENLASVGTFGAAYMTVVIVEPLLSLGVLAIAKALGEPAEEKAGNLLQPRVYAASA